ncbi:hypothetical protein AcetOrient_orf02642 [Acetobacter orientalis]|uniref:Uncharacterized protein n=1 Tax=Acetobacter orientalis TaxID=146474 RepID=A0A2Z5ZI15_9PROT|nr:hypothetical protein AcetOrient_orf02642 [Acetobacter orientalis]
MCFLQTLLWQQTRLTFAALPTICTGKQTAFCHTCTGQTLLA